MTLATFLYNYLDPYKTYDLHPTGETGPVVLAERKSPKPLWKQTLLIASYFTVILPVLAICAKYLCKKNLKVSVCPTNISWDISKLGNNIHIGTRKIR